jgi:hypothetical protein
MACLLESSAFESRWMGTLHDEAAPQRDGYRLSGRTSSMWRRAWLRRG